MLARTTALLSVILASVAHADVTYSDGTFAPTDWGFQVAVTGIASGSASQRTTGGNPDFCRRLTNTVTSASGGTVWSFSRFGTTFDTRYVAAEQGEILSIDFSIDSRVVQASSQNQEILPALKQATVVYAAAPGATTPGGGWSTYSVTGLTASDFQPILGAGPPPDFSVFGAPIRFGFIAKNSSTGSAFTMIVDYDNYFVRVVPPPCDSIDFNRDEIFPDNQDLLDFLLVFSGGACPTDPPVGNGCNDIDFNNDQIYPDSADLELFLLVFGGGTC